MSSRETFEYLLADLRRLVAAAKRPRKQQPYDLSHALERVGGDIEAWVHDPHEARYLEAIELQDVFYQHAPPLILQPRLDVGRRPSAFDVDRLLESEKEKGPAALSPAQSRRSARHKVKDLADLINNSELSRQERNALRRYVIKSLEDHGLGSDEQTDAEDDWPQNPED